MFCKQCMAKAIKTIYFDSGLWMKLRRYALDHNKSASQIIEDLVRKKIGEKKTVIK